MVAIALLYCEILRRVLMKFWNTTDFYPCWMLLSPPCPHIVPFCPPFCPFCPILSRGHPKTRLFVPIFQICPHLKNQTVNDEEFCPLFVLIVPPLSLLSPPCPSLTPFCPFLPPFCPGDTPAGPKKFQWG